MRPSASGSGPVVWWILSNVILGVFLLWLGTEWVLYSRNSLFHDGRWIAAKRMQKMGLMGADEFLIDRDPLAGNRLNLGSKWGAQEVLTRESFTPDEIRFQFQLTRESYVNLLVGESKEGFFGIRFSRHPAVPSGVFEADRNREFTRFVPLAVPLPPDAWIHAAARFSEKIVRIELDGKSVHQGDFQHVRSGRVGFRGSLAPSFVRDPEIVLQDGNRVSLGFPNGALRGRIRIGLFLLEVVSAIVLCVLIVPRKKSGTRMISVLRANLLGFSMTAVLLGVLYAFDWFHWSGLPLSASTQRLNGVTERSFLTNCERLRLRFFDAFSGWLGTDALSHEAIQKRGYPMDRIWVGPVGCSGDECGVIEDERVEQFLRKPKTGLRVLFSGSSQTIGAGAGTLENTFFARLHIMLRGRIPGGRSLESLNIAVSGDFVEKQFRRFEEIWLKYDPDLIVLNWGNNDSRASLRRGVSSFLETARRRRIAVLLLLEANSAESGNLNLPEKHRILSELGQAYGVPVFDLHSALLDPEVIRNGFYWWDRVHLTDAGQRRVAEILAPRLLSLLSKAGNQGLLISF